MSRRRWLGEIPWEMVVWQNEQLCAAKLAHHGPSSDSHAECAKLWKENWTREMSLEEMVDFCRRCHRLAPFTNFNGNTFAAIARALIDRMELSAATAAFARSLAGHIVAGVAGDEEISAFRKFCREQDSAP